MQYVSDRYHSIVPFEHEFIWKNIIKNINDITEIRIRAQKPILIYLKQKELSIAEDGDFIYETKKGKRFTYQEIQQLLDFWCLDSRYAFQNEIKRGFLTIEGGHRVGICGEMVVDEKGMVNSIKYVSSLNIRIAHEIKGVADKVIDSIYKEKQVRNTLIVSAPGAGKTTLLRDIVRQLSDGNEKKKGITVGLVDERGEIAACFQGIPQLDVGMRTDVLDNCEKVIGMKMLLRSMAPAVIAVDELGNVEELELVQQMHGKGCGIIASVHGNNIEEIKRKKIFNKIMEDNVFKNIIFLFKKNYRFCMELYCDGE